MGAKMLDNTFITNKIIIQKLSQFIYLINRICKDNILLLANNDNIIQVFQIIF